MLGDEAPRSRGSLQASLSDLGVSQAGDNDQNIPSREVAQLDLPYEKTSSRGALQTTPKQRLKTAASCREPAVAARIA